MSRKRGPKLYRFRVAALISLLGTDAITGATRGLTVSLSARGLLARQIIGNRSYKQDTRKKQTPEQLIARLDLFEGIANGRLHNRYSLGVKAHRELCEDPGGDHLDALLCAIQAAWAWQMGVTGFRPPNAIDPLEGWIADPLPFRSMSNASPKFLERG